MAERLNKCPVVKAHNPETMDMNMKATLRCGECDHEWEGLVSSPHHEKMRARGWVI